MKPDTIFTNMKKKFKSFSSKISYRSFRTFTLKLDFFFIKLHLELIKENKQTFQRAN